MDRLFRPSSIRREPLITLCWIIAITAIVGGVFVMSPWLIIDNPSGSAALFETVTTSMGLWALGGLAIFSGVQIVYGILKNKIRWVKRGLLLNLILRIYTFIISLLVYGAASPWISGLTVLSIVLVLYLAVAKASG